MQGQPERILEPKELRVLTLERQGTFMHYSHGDLLIVLASVGVHCRQLATEREVVLTLLSNFQGWYSILLFFKRISSRYHVKKIPQSRKNRPKKEVLLTLCLHKHYRIIV